jgi:2-(1,2-epoxy-1,2-dihydrophenyl)acetyl-CoA isomerase
VSRYRCVHPLKGGPPLQDEAKAEGDWAMGEIRTLDTGTEFLLGRVEDGVAVLAFNRPERLNALHPEMMAGFRRVLPGLAADDGVGAVLVTGTGRGFCAGGDVRAQSERAEKAATGGEGQAAPSLEDRIQDLRQRQAEVSAALFEFPKVTIAALPGPAAGAGLSIALSCDLRVAAPTAMITTAFAKVGFSGDFGGSWFLTRLVGLAKATELYLTSDKVSAEDALRLGIVNAILRGDDFQAEALAYAATFANGPRVAYRYMKENLHRAQEVDLRTALDGEAVAMTRTAGTSDHREAARAFVEKRSPEFTGR